MRSDGSREYWPGHFKQVTLHPNSKIFRLFASTSVFNEIASEQEKDVEIVVEQTIKSIEEGKII